MKKLLTITLLFLATTTNAQVWNELSRADRLTHAGAGYVLTGATTAIAYNFTENDWQAEIVGLFVGLCFAAGKEAWDEGQGRQADMWDLGATAIGSVAAVVTIRVIPSQGRKQKSKLKIKLGTHYIF